MDLHEKRCSKKPGECHCHEKNNDIWTQKQGKKSEKKSGGDENGKN